MRQAVLKSGELPIVLDEELLEKTPGSALREFQCAWRISD